ncbi:uncharacterized protein [Miscanthus floridulus]|uniref:uncharacterized protein n=1 Tax=Miscanthus floridulus TaxID=154761 RepID=UPI003458D310
MSALEAILAAVPSEYRKPLGAKSSAKEAWEAIAAMRQEYANLKFKDGESVEDLSLSLQTLISKLRSHDVTIDEEETVSKYLYSVPAKYIHIALSIETMLNLSNLTIKDVTGQLWMADERLEQEITTKDNGKLLLIEEEWATQRNSKEASSSRGGDGKRRGKSYSEKKKKAKEKEGVMEVKGPGKALKAVYLDKPCTQVHLGRVGGDQEQRWYLDSSTSNHMMGSKTAFSKLDDDVTGMVKFGDGSRVAI